MAVITKPMAATRMISMSDMPQSWLLRTKLRARGEAPGNACVVSSRPTRSSGRLNPLWLGSPIVIGALFPVELAKDGGELLLSLSATRRNAAFASLSCKLVKTLSL